MLGVVSPNGMIYFSHVNINEVRAWLRKFGFECARRGWINPETGEVSAIYFDDGYWSAARRP